MQEKTKRILCRILDAVILAGIMMLATGLYYWLVKAGIPYQDPPLELQIQYAVHMAIGDVLVRNGFGFAVCGGIIRVCLGLIWRKRD